MRFLCMATRISQVSFYIRSRTDRRFHRYISLCCAANRTLGLGGTTVRRLHKLIVEIEVGGFQSKSTDREEISRGGQSFTSTAARLNETGLETKRSAGGVTRCYESVSVDFRRR
jgi:hypothetical protein